MIAFERENDRAVVRPEGEDIVASTTAGLRAMMRSAIAEGTRELVVDLAHVRMVDSSGIGLLISAHNSLTKAGGRLVVVHASDEIMDLFQSMRIHQHFEIRGA